ncbi:intraflagellar transport 54 [Aphomia sociella]
MEKELAPDVIKATQTSLGKYVKRPPLSEKLLKKPPFRYLHDIVTTVLKTTGFFEGLFDEDELISENVKDRDNKIQFLNKVIYVVGATTGKTLSVKSSKIVAGQEAEKTNELLQCLAQALDKKLTSNDAVKKYKEDKKSTQTNEKKTTEAPKSIKKSTDTKKLTSKSTEKLTSNKKDTNVRAPNKNESDKTNPNKTKQKENTVTKNESPPKKVSQNKVLTKKPSLEKNSSVGLDKKQHNDEQKKKETNSEKNATDIQGPKNDIENTERLSVDNLEIDLNGTEKEKDSNTVLEEKNDSMHTIDNQLNSSLSSQDLMEIGNKIEDNTISLNSITTDTEYKVKEEQKNTDLVVNSHNEIELDKNKHISRNNSKESSSHESTSSEDKNKVQNPEINKSPVKNENIARPLSMRPSSSRPGAPRLRDKHENAITEAENLIVGKVNIIVENASIEEEEETNVMFVEQETTSPTMRNDQEPLQLSSDQHGHLVQQILESQKEFSQINGKTEIEWHFGAQKAREALNREIEQLRYNIQALSRVTNPLGKILDHIQEDVEVMRQELQQWSKIYEETSKQLSKQKMLNEESLLPLHTKAKQLDTDIQEKHDKINDLKVVIHKNSIRIEKLLASGNVQ